MGALLLVLSICALAPPLILALGLAALILSGWIVAGLITLAGGLITWLISIGGPLALWRRLHASHASHA